MNSWDIMCGDRRVAVLGKNGIARILDRDRMPYDLWFEAARAIGPSPASHPASWTAKNRVELLSGRRGQCPVFPFREKGNSRPCRTGRHNLSKNQILHPERNDRTALPGNC